MNDPSYPTRPLRSDLINDEEMRELIREFVDEMPARISEFESAWRDASANNLARLAHQLKGAAGGYGFGIVGDAAAALEQAVKRADQDLSAVKKEFDDLIKLCGRAAF